MRTRASERRYSASRPAHRDSTESPSGEQSEREKRNGGSNTAPADRRLLHYRLLPFEKDQLGVVIGAGRADASRKQHRLRKSSMPT